MKSCIPIFLFLMVSMISYSQTNEEEYLYLTFGYQEQLQKGLDDKKGYSWKTITQYKFSNKSGLPVINKTSFVSSFQFEGLYRDKESYPHSIVCIYRKDESVKKRDGIFIPIPHHKSGQDILAKADEYLKKEINLKPEILYHYSIALSRLVAQQSQPRYNSENF